MLTENLIAATLAVNKQSAHTSSALKDVGIFNYEVQPQCTFRSGFKKSSIRPRCLAISNSHIFAAQADKTIVNVYSREKGNLEVTVPFPEKVHSVAYAERSAVLVVGTEDGRVTLWETTSGRITSSSASHLQSVSHLSITQSDSIIVSGSADSSLHIWSLSSLISFTPDVSSHNNAAVFASPLRTFSKHRAEITALDVGHSSSSTNFAVSTSSDQTCYIWHISTCQILRTLLMPCNSICLTIDPADRAIYAGYDNGRVQHIDLFGQTTKTLQTSIFDSPDSTPVQLSAEDQWSQGSSEIGATICMSLSFDGTQLLTGHLGGTIVRWDVAKHRVISEVADLHQPVSAVILLSPTGLNSTMSPITVPNVTKPRLELSSEAVENSLRVPNDYKINVQIAGAGQNVDAVDADTVAALDNPGFPTSMLDDAIQAMLARSAGVSGTNNASAGDISSEVKISRLQNEITALQGQLKKAHKLEEGRRQRQSDRAERRVQLGQQKREAYFAAKQNGKDGDAAMKTYEEQESILDAESDEDGIDAQMDVDS